MFGDLSLRRRFGGDLEERALVVVEPCGDGSGLSLGCGGSDLQVAVNRCAGLAEFSSGFPDASLLMWVRLIRWPKLGHLFLNRFRGEERRRLLLGS